MKRQTVNQTLKRLAVDLASHPFLLFLAFLGTIAQVGLSIYLPILIGQVIDQVLVAGSSPVFWQIFLQMLLVVIGNTLVQWANPLLYNRLIFSYTRDLRERIIHKLHRLPIAFVDRQGSGEMVSRVTTDIEQLAAGLTMIFNQFFIGVLMILVSILAMLQIHLLMTLLVLLLTPLSMVISRFIAKVAIVGPTGAGKSTLINLLMRFYPISSGDILLDGQSIYDYTRVSLRQQFGMVLQETWLTQGTIHDNIAFGNPEASREQVIAAAKAANADFFIQQLPQGYDTKLENAGESLSVGQAQLLTIARVFLAIPKILILDEATSSIDTRTEVLVQDAFAKLMKGRTSFIIAHRLSTIQDADLILVLVDGDIVEYGNHQELMDRKGKYYQMQKAAAFSSE
ncbi:TPA: ATP-binding cassette domain-containing protein [Streptococcus pneumoniae]|nr:ATP-binding cassette domain-containing protein [Streptococcus pneumoniae]